MPAYNAAAYIGEAIDSLLAQTFTGWELVVCDDCSTDATRDVVLARAASDSRIRLVSTRRQSGGPTQGRRLSARAASAPYFVEIDADDVVAPDFIESLVARLRDTVADVVIPSLWKFTGSPDRAVKFRPVDGFDQSVVLPGPEAFGLSLGWLTINGNGLIVRRELFLECMERYIPHTDNPYADEILSRTILHGARKVAFSTTRYFYRQCNASVTHAVRASRFAMLLTNLRQRNIFYEWYAGTRPPESLRRLMESQIYLGLLDVLTSGAMRRLSGPDRRTVRRWLHMTYRALDFDCLAATYSGPMFRLLRIGFWPSMLILPLYGRLKTR